MAVSTEHRQFQLHRWKWRRCRDVIAGKDAMLQSALPREAYVGSLYAPQQVSTSYVPKLDGQSAQDYINYCERAAFFNATARTLDAFTGLIFGKDPVAKLPARMEPFAKDITLSGTNLREFAEQVVEQQLAVGRVAIVVDMPDTGGVRLTQAEAELRNLRPFLRWYAAENVINWKCQKVGGVEVLTLLVLKEMVEKAVDEFESEEVVNFRALMLTPEGYVSRVYDENGDLLSEVFPRMGGAPMSFIPATILGASSCSADVQKPPMLDLVDTNIAHLRNSADYEHGLHFTGLPTPYVSGVQLSEGQQLSLGSTSAWIFPDPAANVGFLEFKGEGLKAVREAMKDKEHRMAVLGARMLADDKRTAEAFGTVELKTAGERSALASAARAASDGLTRCLNWMARWVGAPEEAQLTLNTDFGAARMAPQMLTALVAAYQTGGIPLQVLFENLQRGELVNPEMDFEQFEQLIEDDGPSITRPNEEGADNGGAGDAEA